MRSYTNCQIGEYEICGRFVTYLTSLHYVCHEMGLPFFCLKTGLNTLCYLGAYPTYLALDYLPKQV